jgi:hypothetical protein
MGTVAGLRAEGRGVAEHAEDAEDQQREDGEVEGGHPLSMARQGVAPM